MSYVGSSRYEEIKKKVNSGTYSGAAKVNNNTVNSSTSTYKGSERYEAIKKKVNEQGYNSVVDDDYISSYMKDSEAFYKDADAAYRASGYMSTKSNYDLYRKKYSDLAIRKRNIEDYLDDAKMQEGFKSSEEFNRLYDYIKNDSSSMYDVVQQFGAKDAEMSKFSSQSEYLKAQKVAIYREKLETADTDKASEDLADIDARIAKLKQDRSTATSAYMENGGVYSKVAKEGGLNAEQAKKYNAWEHQDSAYDKQIKDLEKQRGEKSVYLNRAKNIQKATKLADEAKNSEDFKKFASMNGIAIDSNSEKSEMLNGEKFAHEFFVTAMDGDAEATAGASTYKTFGKISDESEYEKMTDEEIMVYNYYRNKGEIGKANEYLKSIEEDLAGRVASEWGESLKNHTALELAFGVAAGLDQHESGVRNLFNTKDDYIAPSAWQVASSIVREDLDDVGGKFLGNSVGQWGYDFVTTTSNMLPSILVTSALSAILPAAGVPLAVAGKATLAGNIVSGVGAATLGASAAGNAYAEMLNLGYNKGQARAYSTLVGASEAGLQYALGGISKLGGKVSGNVITKASTKLASALDSSIGKIAVEYGTKFAGNMLSEGLEESLQDIIEPAFRMLVLDDENAYDDFKLSDALYSGILGALSAGLLEGGGTISEARQTVKASNLIGEAMKTEGFTDKLTSLGQTFSADSVAYKIASKVNENTTSYEMLQLLDSVNATLSEQNKSDIVKSMVEQGVLQKDAKKAADVVAGYLAATGSINENVTAFLDLNKPLRKALYNEIIDPNATTYQKLMGRVSERNAILDTVDEVAKAKEKPSESKFLPKSAQNASEDVSEGKSIPETESASNGVTEANNDIPDRNIHITEFVESKDVDGKKIREAKIKLDNGKTVSVADAELSDSDINYISNVAFAGYDAETANEIIAFAKENNIAPSSARFAALDMEWRAGYYGSSIAISESPFSDSQIKAIRDIGKNSRERRDSGYSPDSIILVNKNKGKLVDDTDSGLDNAAFSDRQKSSVEVAKKLSSIVRNKTHIFESIEKDGKYILSKDLKDSKGNIIKRKGETAPNGFFDPNSGELFIDINAGEQGEGLVMYTLAHEYVHFIRHISPKAFNKLADVVVSELENAGVNINERIDAEIAKAKRNGREISFDVAYEEFVADTLETQLTSNDTAYYLNKIYEADKNIFTHLKNKLREFYLAFKDMVKGYENLDKTHRTPYSAELEKLSRDALKRISAAYAEALKVAAGEYQNVELKKAETKAEKNTADSGVKYQLRGYSEKQIQNWKSSNKIVICQGNSHLLKFVYDALAGKNIGKKMYFGTPNDLLVKRVFDKTGINIDRYNVSLAATEIRKIKKSHGDNKKEILRGQRAVTPNDYFNILDTVQNPTDINLSPETYGGKPVIVFVSDYSEKITVAAVVSDKHLDLFIQTAYIGNKKRNLATPTSEQADINTPEASSSTVSNNKIPQDNSVVNSNSMQNSENNAKELHSDRDSHYLDLAKDPEKNKAELQKMVDEAAKEAGYTNAMFRGDSSTINVFDRKKSKYSNLYGRGFYFTDSESHASTYGKAKKYYLQMSNPLNSSQGTKSFSREQIYEFLSAIAEDEDYGIENYGERATVESISKDLFGKSDYQILNDINATCIGDFVAAVELFNSVNGTNYDGIIVPTETVVFKSNQIKSADPVTYDDNGNVIPLSERFNESKNDIRFSLRDNVEETEDLIAVHNLTEDKLLKSLSLGGLPMPSIAIMKAAQSNGNDGYGNISLVFGKDSIDPKFTSKNKLYGGDAWTPTFPPIEYEVNEAAADILRSKYYELYKKYPQIARESLYDYVYDAERKLANAKGIENVISDLKSDTKMMRAFLADTENKVIPNIQKEVVSKLDEATREQYDFFIEKIGKDIILESKVPDGEAILSFRHKYLDKYETLFKETYIDYLRSIGIEGEGVENVLNSIRKNELLNIVIGARKYINNRAEKVSMEFDRTATDNAIKNAVDEKKYSDWLNSLFGNLESRKGIRNQKDAYTKSGNMRSWSALHYELSLENVVKAMKEQNNGDVAIFTGMGLWGVAAKEYGTVSEMKADKSRLKEISDEEIKAIKGAYGDRFTEIALSLKDNSSGNEFIALDNAFANILDAVRTKKTKSGVLSYLQTFYGNNVTESTVDDILNLIVDVGNMPTRYFEAKPQRAVGFDEVKAVVIPNNASQELKSALQGYNVLEYNADEPSARTDVLNSMDDLKFSERDSAKQPDRYKFDYLTPHLKQSEWDLLNYRLSQEIETSDNYLDSATKWLYNESKGTKVFAIYGIGDGTEPTVLYAVGGKKAERIYNDTQRFMEVDNDESNRDREAFGRLFKTLQLEKVGKADYISDLGNRGTETENVRVLLQSQGSNSGADNSRSTEDSESGASFSERDPDALTNRQILAEALETATQNGFEKELIEKYKSKIDFLDEQESKLKSLKAQIKELSFAKGKRDTEKLLDLRIEATKTANRINIADSQLLKIEATSPFKSLLDRNMESLKKAQEAKMREAVKAEREKSLEKQQVLSKEYRERIKRNVEGRAKTVVRNKIKKIVAELSDTLLKPTKEKNIKIGVQKPLAEALLAFNWDTVDYERAMDELNLELSKAASISDLDRQQKRIYELLYKMQTLDAKQSRYDDNFNSLINAWEDIAKSEDKLVASGYDENITELVQGAKDFLKQSAEERIEELDEEIANETNAFKKKKLQIKKEAYENGAATSLINMNLEELETVYDVFKAIKTRISNVNELFADEKDREIAVSAAKVIDELSSSNKDALYSKESTEWLKKSFLFNNLEPSTFMELLGSETFNRFFNNLRKCEETYIKDTNDVHEFAVETKKKYHHKDWDFKKHYRFVSANGNSFSLTLGNIMSLYAYSRRSKTDKHLFKGGVLVSELLADKATVKTEEKLAKIREKMSKEADEKALQVLRKQYDETEKQLAEREMKSLRYKLNDAKPNVLNQNILDNIIGTLTDDQKAYVNEMQRYLSEVMGEKGNEVTLMMYGIKWFKEKFYFPLKSAKQYLASKTDVKGEFKLVNSSFTKSRIEDASNPIVLEDFDDVWSKHCINMSNYHSLILALEDFNRIYNYGFGGFSVKEMLNTKFSGGQATEYIETLLKDINGGVGIDKTSGLMNRNISKFKKAAVFLSSSVVIQQRTAMGRAMAYIPLKYFAKSEFSSFLKNLMIVATAKIPGLSEVMVSKLTRHNQEWQRVIEHAPIAMIKDRGGFSTGLSSSDTDFINSVEYEGLAERLKAFITDGNFRDEILSAAPALADQNTWIQIFKAAENQVQHETDLEVESEEYWNKVKEIFDNVILKTQVYDSVFSKSPMMRSTDTGVKMLMAFSAEPQKTINMYFTAWLNSKRGNKAFAGRVVVCCLTAAIWAALAKSISYAERDDDDDKTFFEKFIGEAVGNIAAEANPIRSIPFARDILSLIDGYDIERSDMSAYADVINGVLKFYKAVNSEDGATWKDIETFVGSVANLFGIPVRNLSRDIRGMYNTINQAYNGNKTTRQGIKQSIKENIPFIGKETSKSDALYDAIMSGEEEAIRRAKARYSDAQKLETGMREAIRDNDERIHQAAQARCDGDFDEYLRIAKEIKAEGNFSQDTIVMAIRNVESKLKPKEESEYNPKKKGYFKADDIAIAIEGNDLAMIPIIESDLVETAIANGKTREAAEKSAKGDISDAIKDLIQSSSITVDKGQSLLEQFCDKESEDAEAQAEFWKFKSQNEDLEYSWNVETYSSYIEDAEPYGISEDVYDEYLMLKKACTGTDANGDGKTDSGSKKRAIMEAINSLPLTNAQKDVLYYQNGWSKKDIGKAPWH